jgi:enoyl-[acyl-carrier protein] reductase I
VKNPLLETSRRGSLALSATLSFIALVQRFGPLLRPGGSFVSLSYMAASG